MLCLIVCSQESGNEGHTNMQCSGTGSRILIKRRGLSCDHTTKPSSTHLSLHLALILAILYNNKKTDEL